MSRYLSVRLTEPQWDRLSTLAFEGAEMLACGSSQTSAMLADQKAIDAFNRAIEKARSKRYARKKRSADRHGVQP